MSFSLKTKLQRLEKLKQEKPAYQRLLEFYGDLYIEKDKCHRRLHLNRLADDASLVQIKLSEGFPVLDKRVVTFDVAAVEAFFDNLLQVARKRLPDAGDKLARALQAGRFNVGDMISGLWAGNFDPKRWSKVNIEDPTLLAFLLVEALKPVYESAALGLQKFVNEDIWKEGYCPICGETPPIAEITAERTRRRLFCIYCGTDWIFSRFCCPFCGEGEADGFISLFLATERHYRIDVCKHCEKYLKVVDTHHLGYRVPLDVENIATLHLDMLAQKEGYRRGAASPLIAAQFIT